MTFALVLGGGGPVGVAWETGILAGLAERGLDAAWADRILGTSAGAIVGSQIAAGVAPRDLYERYLAASALPRAASGGTPDLQPLFEFMMRRRAGMYPGATALAELGAYALRAPTKPEHEFIPEIGQLVAVPTVWPSRFACTAIDATTGVFRTWDESAGVDLLEAVASSCAVPGLYPPITIGTTRYIDGGMRSPTNADLARGSNRLLVLAVTVEPVAATMAEAARRELADAGVPRAALITPDAAALTAFGGNLMDLTRMHAALEAGFAQGRRADGELAALF